MCGDGKKEPTGGSYISTPEAVCLRGQKQVGENIDSESRQKGV